MSRVALWKRVESLKSWGYGIAASRKGYTLDRDDGLGAPDLATGGPVRILAEARSTMDEALGAAREGAPSGTLILALRQSGGRGRFGRRWESPPGGLYLSLVLRSALPPPCSGTLVLEAASVLLDVLGDCGVRGVEFRWPNDLFLEGKKLGGILLEAFGPLDRADFYILGLGLNFKPLSPSIRPAACLGDLSAAAPRRRDVALAVAERMRRWSDSPALEARRWDELLAGRVLTGRAVLWDGRVLAVRPKGFTARGELIGAANGTPLAAGECEKMIYEGESS